MQIPVPKPNIVYQQNVHVHVDAKAYVLKDLSSAETAAHTLGRLKSTQLQINDTNAPWRTLVFSATRYGFEVYWKTESGYTRVPIVDAETIEDLRVKDQKDLTAQCKVNLPLPPVWVPRGRIGLVVHNGIGAFRNVVIKPGPFVVP
jgi:hypothetical protein